MQHNKDINKENINKENVNKENPSYIEQIVNRNQISKLDREKKDELFYTASHGSETHRVLNIEDPRLRLMLMENRYPNSQYICNDVRFRESNDAVPRKGFFERGDKKIEEDDTFVNVTYSRCYLVGRGAILLRNS